MADMIEHICMATKIAATNGAMLTFVGRLMILPQVTDHGLWARLKPHLRRREAVRRRLGIRPPVGAGRPGMVAGAVLTAPEYCARRRLGGTSSSTLGMGCASWRRGDSGCDQSLFDTEDQLIVGNVNHDSVTLLELAADQALGERVF